jgi:hypothetical protein
VVGSRRYRAFEERLISRETLTELERDGTLPIAVDADPRVAHYPDDARLFVAEARPVGEGSVKASSALSGIRRQRPAKQPPSPGPTWRPSASYCRGGERGNMRYAASVPGSAQALTHPEAELLRALPAGSLNVEQVR